VLLSLTDLSILGQCIQMIGVALIALLFHLLQHVLRRTYFLRWAQAWLCMTAALVILQLVFRCSSLTFLEPLYFFGEYLFAFLLWLGLASFPEPWPATRAFIYRAAPVSFAWCVFLSTTDNYFGARFNIHALFFALSLLPSFWVLTKIRLPEGHVWVKLLVAVAILLMFGDFMLNGLSLLSPRWLGDFIASGYSAYQSIIDLLIEVMLAFSLLIMAAVSMQLRLVDVNQTLQRERDSMAMLAHQDALTGCFNRHALIELKTRLRNRQGLVVMVDINELKPINDNYGHATGDMAIVRVAQTLKDFLSPQDYLFRYGGDEFVWVQFDCSELEVVRKLEAVQQCLANLPMLAAMTYPVSLSWGLKAFTDEVSFEQAVGEADCQMYKHKLAIRGA